MEDNVSKGQLLSIGVLGGTGTAGSAVVAELRRRGHEVRVLSRGADGVGRIDLADPATYRPALTGLDVLVDAVNVESTKEPVLRELMVDQLGAVLAVAAEVGVGHVVSLGIIGSAEVPMAYYRVKVAQEQVVRESPLPSSIVRATQFHQLVAAWAQGAARLRPMVMPKGALQPVDPRDVAVVLADAAEAREDGAVREIAGPAIVSVRDLGRTWLAARRPGRTRVLSLPAIGGMLRSVARGALTNPDALRGTITFGDWLAETR